MTIFAETTVRQRLWRGWQDPGLPVGAYIASITVTGDASGGSEFIDFNFAGEGEPVSGRFYNIEQVSSHVAPAASAVGSMTAINWESVGPTGLADRVWLLSWITDGVTAGAMDSQHNPKIPVFLGQPQPIPDLASVVRFLTINVLNRVLFAQIQGYIWQPRSVSVDGGLRRPVEALYG